MAEAFITTKLDMRAARKGLTDIEKQHFPFAFALSLTRMAQRAQQLVQERTRKAFQLHGEWIPKSIKIEGAQKSDIVRYNIAQSRVYTDERIGFMTLQEEGGIKRPSTTKSLAMPSIAMKLAQGFRTVTGKIAKKWKPATLLKKYNAMKQGSGPWNKGRHYKRFKSRHKDPQAFVAKGKVMVRTSDKRYPLQTLYGFKGTAQIKPIWDFVPTVERVVHAEFDSIFRRELASAVQGLP